MLEIKDIVKDYTTASETVHALKGVSIAFRESELVSVLGQSGCGKTTLLNIIGGLDQYTSGDLIINGQSTKKYKSADWDVYRNHSVGFIFQSYNLIPHQTVLSNVELALTLSGVSKTERRRRAKEALEKVGLGNQLNKKPNQMSGGQMQRVAIARALVNDPDILLADEPTGALDSETSIQIMELIKEIAKDRLVIMVTHNPDLAEKYSTRIVNLLDGKIVGDSNPYDPAAEESAEAVRKSEVAKGKKTSMSFGTALSLSKNNLMTKKGRTFLTSFAGSIGIIGIALILSLSNGVQEYINSVERSTLASFPVSLQQETVDYTSLMTSMMNVADEHKTEREPDKIYTNDISTEMVKTMLSEMQTNNLAEFKDYLESNPDNIMDSISEIKYSYDSNLYVYGHDINGNLIQVNPSTVMNAMMGEAMANTMSQMTETYSSMMGGSGSQFDSWEELLSTDMLETEYEVLAGRLPESWNEVVLLVSDRNEVSDVTLYTLGLRDQAELEGMMASVMAGDSFDLDTGDLSFTYDELMGLEFRLLTAPDFYQKNADGTYTDMRGDNEYMEGVLDSAPELKVVGILKPDADSLISSTHSGGIGYTHALTEYMIDRVNNSDIVREQKDNPDVDVFTGIEFPKADEEEKEAMSESAAMEVVKGMLTEEQMEQLNQGIMDSLTEEQLADIQSAMMSMVSEEQMNEIVMGILTPEQLQQLAAAQGAGADMTAVLGALSQEQLQQVAAAVMQTLTAEQQAQLAQLPAEQQAAAALGMADQTQLMGILAQVVGEEQLQQLMGGGSAEAQDIDIASMLTEDQTQQLSEAIMASLTPEQNAELSAMMNEMIEPAKVYSIFMQTLTSDQLMELTKEPESTEATYDGNLKLLGVAELSKPSSMKIYATDFESKEVITQFIEEYNNRKLTEDKQEDVINYTDYVGLMMSSVSDIINAISYILIAFVAISLVVSSIMIGIITYISVLERTKEIGILRAMGASKMDISNVFNAETLIVGFSAGVIGIAVTLLLNIPINIIIENITGIQNVALLPWQGGVILIVISMLLTVIAGLFPARVAAKKDPVVALRTE
ncbi:MAG: ATP-binding cassette domain-containing protein [Oscillospiraceae bacterium]